MTCDACGGPDPVVYLTEVEDNESRTLHLCAACAEEKGAGGSPVPDNFLLAGVLAQLGGEEKAGSGSGTPSGARASSAPTGPCAFCGLTLRNFKESGRLGCPHCWVTFEPQLRPLLLRVQGSVQHVGKVYLPPDPSATERGKRVEGLRRKLDRAVELEDFERAAELRDQIRSLRVEAG